MTPPVRPEPPARDPAKVREMVAKLAAAGATPEQIRRALDATIGPPVAQGPQADPVEPYHYGIVQAGIQGATLGFGDEIHSGLRAAGQQLMGSPRTFGEDYDRNAASYRAGQQQFRREHGTVNLLSELGGAVATALPQAAAAGGSRLLGSAPLVGRMARAGVEGAKMGAVAGFGEAEGGLGERVSGAIRGGITGGVLGGATPAAGAALGGLGRAALRKAGRGEPTVLGQARRQLVEAFDADGVTRGELVQRASRAHPEEVLADLAPVGGTVDALTSAVQATPFSKGTSGIREFANQRVRREGPAMVGALERDMGRPSVTRPTQHLEQLVEAQRTATRPLYAAAEQEAAQLHPDGITSQRVEELTGLPYAAEAWRNVLRNMSAEERKLPTAAVFRIDANGTPTLRMQRAPTLEALTALRRELRNQWEKANAKGDMQKSKVRALSKQLEELSTKLRQEVPALGPADDEFARHARGIDAYKLGEKLKHASADKIEAARRTLRSPEEVRAFEEAQQGAVREALRRPGSRRVRAAALDPTVDGDANLADALHAGLGGRTQALTEEATRRNRFRMKRDKWTEGSRTTPLRDMRDAMGGWVGIAKNLKNPDMYSLLFAQVADALKHRGVRVDAERADELTRYLLAGQHGGAEMMNRVGQLLTHDTRIRRIRGSDARLARIVGRLAPGQED